MMKSSLGWQVAECFLVNESTGSSIDAPVGVTNALNVYSQDSAICTSRERHCKTLQDGAEFPTAPKKTQRSAPARKSSIRCGEGWVSG
jgi:hypothetical protein